MTPKTKRSSIIKSLTKSAPPDEIELIADRLIEGPSFPAICWLDEPESLFDEQTPGSVVNLPEWISALSPDAKPGRHPAHSAGLYYCLDLSSALLGFWGLSGITNRGRNPQSVLDLCASPGGKSVLAWRYLKPERLVCNEVIGKRLGALISNLKRCHIAPAEVTNLEVGEFARRTPEHFELVIVDAPCSGQSIFSSGAFHHTVINGNSNRQKRILANAAQTVTAGGHLMYLTCTYSRAENEKVVEWLIKRFPNFKPTEISAAPPFHSHLAEFPCYRIWPHQGVGQGGFLCLLENTQGASEQKPSQDEALAFKPVWQSN